MKRLFSSLVLVLALLAPATARAERQRLTPQEAFELGQRYLKRGYYVKALEQFNRVRTYFPDDPHATRAQIAIADLHFRKNEWDQARMAYEDFARGHKNPNSPDYDLGYVYYRLGLCMDRKSPTVAARDQTWTRQAVATWANFAARFPASEYRDEVEGSMAKARNRLARKELLVARFYDQRDAWPAVVSRLEAMLRDYPDSPDRAEALALLAVAYVGVDRVPDAEQALERLRADAPAHPGIRRVEAAIQRGPPPAEGE